MLPINSAHAAVRAGRRNRKPASPHRFTNPRTVCRGHSTQKTRAMWSRKGASIRPFANTTLSCMQLFCWLFLRSLNSAASGNPTLMFFHAVSFKRALLSPATAMPKWVAAHEAPWLCADWGVYQLEKDAFASVVAAEPREWESWRWIPWLVCAVYVVAFGIPLIDSDAASAVIVMVAVIALYALARWRRAARKRLQAQSGPRELMPSRSGAP